ncbi:hypothetical protein ACTFIR_003968 [Dictyostelium discoideum]
MFFKLITREEFIQKGNENYYNKVIDKLKENGETEFRLEFAKSIKYKNNKYSIKDFISIKGDGERVWYGQIFDILALLNVNDNKLKEINHKLSTKGNKIEIKERIETYYDDRNCEMGDFQRTMSLRYAFRNIGNANYNTETFIENKNFISKTKAIAQNI